jgi:hypothetical protein
MLQGLVTAVTSGAGFALNLGPVRRIGSRGRDGGALGAILKRHDQPAPRSEKDECMRLATKVLTAILVIVALRAAAAGSATPSATGLVDFTMLDQFDAEHRRADLAGEVVVLIWVDRKGRDHLDRWQRTLERKLKRERQAGEVELRVVAHVRGVPGFVKGRVKDSFGDDPERWALMDWEGIFLDAYPMVEDHCNLLVFGRDGALLHHDAATGLAQAVLDGVLAAVTEGLAGGAPDRDGAPAAAGED